ncbi:MAG: hypothetical protein HY859_04860 [Caulobacterales bacterium]|nr:hypothetical protein [Caulobacterales bacterium]
MRGWDILVFEPEVWRSTGEKFWHWVEELREWLEDRNYDDPTTTTPRLSAWFAQSVEHYPRTENFPGDNPHPSEGAQYFIGDSAIHARYLAVDADEAVVSAVKWARALGLGYAVGGIPATVMTPNSIGDYHDLHWLYPTLGG